MTEGSFYSFISGDDLNYIRESELEWLKGVFQQFKGYPSLEQIWELMDACWRDLGCDPVLIDARIERYYSHPVWLLNGLFIEQHLQSISNRVLFAKWVSLQQPQRVADFGGGFGSLARLIGRACPKAIVEVIEPHPHPLAIERARRTPNVIYRPKLTASYDVLIATDVFEHVPDPLGLIAETVNHLSSGAKYLIANCFEPVILCHLPQTFHFRHSWDTILSNLGLYPCEDVLYGRAFNWSAKTGLEKARRTELRSKKIWAVTKHLPDRIARRLTRLLLSV